MFGHITTQQMITITRSRLHDLSTDEEVHLDLSAYEEVDLDLSPDEEVHIDLSANVCGQLDLSRNLHSNHQSITHFDSQPSNPIDLSRNLQSNHQSITHFDSQPSNPIENKLKERREKMHHKNVLITAI
eukprot:984489_1